MVASTNVDVQRLGKFHPKCRGDVTLSEDRRIASGGIGFSIALSNDPIPIGVQFSVKILQKGFLCVSPISAPSRPHTPDAPYTARSVKP